MRFHSRLEAGRKLAQALVPLLKPPCVVARIPRGGVAIVIAPTLLIVGGHDFAVIEMNRDALAKVRAGANAAGVRRALPRAS